MPICDWAKVDSGLFHHFHQRWVGEIIDLLNSGGLPPGRFALIGPSVGWRGERETERYAAKASEVVIRDMRFDVVSTIQIVSLGNKLSHATLREFVTRCTQYIRNGVHVLVVDLFPPTARDPQGIHKEIWSQFDDAFFELPPDKPLTLASYSADAIQEAYVEPVAVGDALPDMPLFLEPGHYITVPLEATYDETWRKCPEPYRQAVTDAQVR